MNMDFCLLPLLVLCVALSCSSVLRKCSSFDQCMCSQLKDRTWAANCSNLGLRFFPKFQEDVSVIFFTNNCLRHGNESSQLPSNLRELYLSKNNLSYNGLSNVSFIKNLFRLEILDISDNVNNKSSMRVTYPTTEFRSLKKLKALYIDGLWGGDFNAKDWNLTSLTNLTVSGKTGKCYFDRLHQSFFSGLPNLQFLSITGCRLLRSIDKNVFRDLTGLHTLDISFNEQLTFAPLQNVSCDLQFTDVQIFRAKKLHCSFGLGTVLLLRDFVNFKNTSIKEFDLSSNRIEVMDFRVLEYFPSYLEILNVSENQFTWGKFVLFYTYLRNLRIADVSGQYSYKYHNVDALSCENNLDCTETVSPINSNESSYYLKNSRNITFYIPPQLEKIYFHTSQFRFSVGEIHIGGNQITEYHMQNNFLYGLDGPIYGGQCAQFLDLSGNFIKYVSPVFFDGTPNIRYLNFSNNLLGNCLSDGVQQDHFRGLTRLLEINLSHNGISSLPRKLLSNAVSLQRVDLSHNLMTHFIFTINDRSALRYLDLSFNRLREISRETIDRLEDIHKRTNLSVVLSGNLFDCTCETTFFLNWIHNSKINFVNKEMYICGMSHNRRLKFIDLVSILKELESKCSSDLPITIGITVSVMTIFTVSITCTFYKYRWSIRYFFYLSKWEIQEIVNPRKEKHQRSYEYSAFIAYAEKESNFAETVMMHQLEELNEIKLCLPNRDFSPNLRTYANVLQAIHNSKKIICIITEDFLEDYWCMYQLQMAEEERIRREDEDCLVFILFKPLSIDNFGGIRRSLFLVSIIEQRSYALFPENEADHSTFWKKLMDTVQ